MAGASMNDIKARIKSVGSTMQITRAMELVATSKLRRAKEMAERTRPFYEKLKECIDSLLSSDALDGSVWTEEREGKTLFVTIAGDRGLAGGYNSNVFKLTEALSDNIDYSVLPIGKKAIEYMKHKNKEILSEEFSIASDIGVGEAMAIGSMITDGYLSCKFTKVVLVYTRFVSMMTQSAVYEQLLPLEGVSPGGRIAEYDSDPEEMAERLVSDYSGGVIWSVMCESVASEHGARRTAMNSANKNAEEMINTLMLKFNRARQAVITQEITEIVSGAEAL